MVIETHNNISDADIRALLKGESDDEKALACYNLCYHIDKANINGQERKLADEILRVVVGAADDKVKQALAVTLKSSDNLPNDVALSLVKDSDEIALPLLGYSPALSDDDLIDILSISPPLKQAAIAKRAGLSSDLSDAICKYADYEAIKNLLKNKSVKISYEDLLFLQDRFPDGKEIALAIVDKMPAKNTLKDEKPVPLNTKSLNLADNESSSEETEDKDFIAEALEQSDLVEYLKDLHSKGRLNTSFIIRALCIGEVRLVETAMTELAGIKIAKAWLLIRNDDSLEPEAVYNIAGLESEMLPVFNTAVEILRNTEFNGSAKDRKHFQDCILNDVFGKFPIVSEADCKYVQEKFSTEIKNAAQYETAAA